MNDSSGPDIGRGSVPDTGMGSGNIATSMFEIRDNSQLFYGAVMIEVSDNSTEKWSFVNVPSFYKLFEHHVLIIVTRTYGCKCLSLTGTTCKIKSFDTTKPYELRHSHMVATDIPFQNKIR